MLTFVCINDRKDVGKTSISVKIKAMVGFVFFTPTLIMHSLKKKENEKEPILMNAIYVTVKVNFYFETIIDSRGV